LESIPSPSERLPTKRKFAEFGWGEGECQVGLIAWELCECIAKSGAPGKRFRLKKVALEPLSLQGLNLHFGIEKVETTIHASALANQHTGFKSELAFPEKLPAQLAKQVELASRGRAHAVQISKSAKELHIDQQRTAEY